MLTGRWQTWDESAAGQSFCLPYLTYIYGAVPIPPAQPLVTARGPGATRGGMGLLHVAGAVVQYAQPSSSRSPPSWSRPTFVQHVCGMSGTAPVGGGGPAACVVAGGTVGSGQKCCDTMSPSGVVPFQEQTVTRSLAARTRVLAASAALLLAVGALAGCSDHPGQVADMHYTGLDGARHSVVVSEKDVDVVVKELDSALGRESLERQGVNRPQIAGLLVQAPAMVEVGQAHGVTVTDAQTVQWSKERLGFEPRQAATITYLRAIVLSGKYQELAQQGQQGQAVISELNKLYGTLDGDVSPRYSNKAQTWLTQTDPRLEAGNNPFGGGLQQAPQQDGGQQQAPQQQQGGGQQQAPQQQQQPQQQAPQQGGQQPADSGQTDGQGQTGQADGAAGEGGQGAEQPETSGQ